MPAALPVWTDEELAAASAVSQAGVIERILGATYYREAFPRHRDEVVMLFERTADLRQIDPAMLVAAPQLVTAFRFTFAPPLSNDTVKEHVGGAVDVRRLPLQRAEAVVELIRKGLDTLRFPWLIEGREPTGSERELAITWTAGLMAVERARTDARIRPSRDQEARVKQVLEAAGLTRVARPRRGIKLISDLVPGTFTDETHCGSRQADIPARLFDGRLLLIEAKISGTQLNSWKRLINDSCTKAPDWRREFGDGAVVPVAVLSGAFALEHLKLAQGPSYRMLLIWDHRLDVLREFVQRARPE